MPAQERNGKSKSKPMKNRGGKREGAGRKPSAPTATHPVRCTDDGWKWLQAQAFSKGHTSVGKWADAKGRKAPKRKANASLSHGDESATPQAR